MLSVIVKPCADALQIENGDVVFTFSIFSIASTALIQLNSSYLLPRVRVPKILSMASLIFAISCYLFFQAHDAASLAWAFTLLGAGLGMGFSTANYLLVSNYEGRERSSKLALLTFFYCVGAVITPALGGHILQRGEPWQYAFLWPILIFWVGTIFSFSVPSKLADRQKMSADFRSWPRQVYAVALALFLFSLAEISFTNWLNVDGEEVMKLSTEHAAYLASVFWFVVGVGRYSASRILLKIRGKVFVLLSCSTAIVGFFLYHQVETYQGAIFAVLVLGLGLAAVNPTLTSMGSALSKSPGLLGFLLTVASLGPVVAPATSQWVYTNYGSSGNIASCLSYLLVVLVIVGFLKTDNLGHKVGEETEDG